MYLTREGDTIPYIHKLNQYYGTNMLPVMAFQECPILLFGMHSDDRHISMLNYLLHTLVHIAQDETYILFVLLVSSMFEIYPDEICFLPATCIGATHFSNSMACWLNRCTITTDATTATPNTTIQCGYLNQIQTFSTSWMQFLLRSQARITTMRQFTSKYQIFR